MGSVVQLKQSINNSYTELLKSVEDKLTLVDEKISSKLSSRVELIQKMTGYHLDTGGKNYELFLHYLAQNCVDILGVEEILILQHV